MAQNDATPLALETCFPCFSRASVHRGLRSEDVGVLYFDRRESYGVCHNIASAGKTVSIDEGLSLLRGHTPVSKRSESKNAPSQPAQTSFKRGYSLTAGCVKL